MNQVRTGVIRLLIRSSGEQDNIEYDSDDECADDRRNWQLAEGDIADDQSEDERQLVNTATLRLLMATALPVLPNSVVNIAADYIAMPDCFDDGGTEIRDGKHNDQPTAFSMASFSDGFHRWTWRINGPEKTLHEIKSGQMLQFGFQHDRDPTAFPNLAIGPCGSVVPRNSCGASRYLNVQGSKLWMCPGSIVQCDLDLDKRRVQWGIDGNWGEFLTLRHTWSYSFAVKSRHPSVVVELLPEECLHTL